MSHRVLLLVCAFVVTACRSGSSGPSPQPAASATKATPEALAKQADEMQQAMLAALDAAPPSGGDVQLGGATSTAYIPDLQRVFAGLRSRMRACYRTGRESDPAMRGKLVIAAQVDAKGEVITSVVATNEGISDPVAMCVASAVKRATFGAPGGIGASVKLPLDLVP